MPVTKVKVNGEWIPAMPVGGGGEGDMTKAVYDTNDDGIVNAADQATKDGSGNIITSTYAAKATTLSGYGITDAKIQNGSIILGSNSITPLTSFTETDPVFIASAAYGISSSDITNWNGKTSNTGTVTKVTAGTGLKKDSASSGGDITTSGTINHINSVTAQNTQAVYPIKIDSCGHISAYGSAVTITSGTVTSVRVQATSPVNSSTNTAQSTSLNTTISLADAYGDTKNPYSTKTANYVLAGPTSGNASAPSFRALVAADIPTLTASKLSDVSISNGTITIGSNSITPVTSSALADYIASDEIGKVYVSDTEPSNTSNYDIWIDTSTTLQNANGVMV